MDVNKSEKEQARADFNGWLQPGDTVYTIIRSVSRSGMRATISVLIRINYKSNGSEFLHPNWSASYLTGYGFSTKGGRDALIVNGCGFDRAQAIVDALSYELYGREGMLRHESL